ncbi:hypothetical protein ACPXCX_57855, partial [Streptomyces sp. DT225]
MKAARRPEVRLPSLVEFEEGGLEPDGDYDGVRFGASVDLADASGRGGAAGVACGDEVARRGAVPVVVGEAGARRGAEY